MSGTERSRALVTGAGSGIGRASALALAACGHAVIVQDIDANGAARTCRLIREAGGTAHAGICDVADAAALRGIVGEHGAVHVLVNNAGTPALAVPVHELDHQAFRRMVDVHVWGALAALQAVLPEMKAAERGVVINISSDRGQVGSELSCHYAAAKAALLGLTKSWARELAPHRIRVNAIAPGFVMTPMAEATMKARNEVDISSVPNLVGRWGRTEEIAFWVAALAHPDAGFMTGQVLAANGGSPIT